MKILLVDDDPTFRFIVRTIVAKADFASIVHEAANGELALQYLDEAIRGLVQTPDIIMLDLNMPVMDGWSFLDTLPGRFPGDQGIPICILTSSINTADQQRSLKYNFVKAFYTKPLSSDILISMQEMVSEYKD